jgi:hypothetical protein
MDEREELLRKLKRYLAIRDRISDELALAIIEELIKEKRNVSHKSRRTYQIDNPRS